MAQTAQAQRRAQRLLRNATKGHGAFMAKVGLVWAFPSLLAFSVGAFIKLGGDGLVPDSVATLSRISATIILLISGVLALEIALASIGSAVARRRVSARMVWDVVLVAVVAPLETWTLYLLITGLPATGPVDLMRAAEAVMATAYLGTLVIIPPTDRDFVRVIGSRAAERAMEKLERIALDAVGMGRLYQVQAVANDETLSWGQRAKQLVSVMEELAPGEQERVYQQRITDAEAARQTADAAAAAARASIPDAAARQTADALLTLVTTGALPGWLVEQRPDLAGVTLDSLMERAGGSQAAGRRGRGAAGVTPIDQSRAGRQRAFLSGLDITPPSPPQGKRGVWLRASDLTSLTGGRSGSETPQALVRRLGDGAMVGRSLAAPFEPVMRELSERRLLTDAAQAWWNGQTSGGDSGSDEGDDSGEMGVVGRSNITPLRA